MDSSTGRSSDVYSQTIKGGRGIRPIFETGIAYAEASIGCQEIYGLFASLRGAVRALPQNPPGQRRFFDGTGRIFLGDAQCRARGLTRYRAIFQEIMRHIAIDRLLDDVLREIEDPSLTLLAGVVRLPQFQTGSVLFCDRLRFLRMPESHRRQSEQVVADIGVCRVLQRFYPAFKRRMRIIRAVLVE